MWQEDENFLKLSEDGELSSREFSSAGLSDWSADDGSNGFLGREPELSECCCWSATSEAHRCKAGSADLQDSVVPLAS